MIEWQTYRISDLGRIVTGKTPPSSQPGLFDGQIPFITPSDMSYDHRDISTERFVSADWDSKKRTLLPARAVCVVCIGATIGKTCMTIKPSQTNQQLNSVIVDHDHFDQGFVYYALRTKVGELVSRAAGAATPILNKTAFSEVEIDAPALLTQRRIASILGAYDDLIEVNRRRIAVLEEMARVLFEEWFVRFRFPGHEAATIEDTPNGPLPQGWSWGIVADVATVVGRSISPGVLPDEVFAHYSLPAFDAGRHPSLDVGDKIKSNKLEFQAPIILVSKLNPRFPRVWYISENLSQRQIASTEFVPLFPSNGKLAWVYATVRSAAFTERLTAMAGGTSTSHQRVKPKDILNTPIAIPTGDLLNKAEQALSPIFEMVRAAEAANRSLAASRDLLLPRLISGQLSVAQAERELEAA